MLRLFVASWWYYLIHNNSKGGEITINLQYSPPQLQLDRTTRWYKGAVELRPLRSALMRLLPASWIVSLELGLLRNHLNIRKVKKNFCRGGNKGSERRCQSRPPHLNSWTKPFTLLLRFCFTALFCFDTHVGRVLFYPKAPSAQVIKALQSNVNIQHMQASRITSRENTTVTTLCPSHLMSPEKDERLLFAASCNASGYVHVVSSITHERAWINFKPFTAKQLPPKPTASVESAKPRLKSDLSPAL